MEKSAHSPRTRSETAVLLATEIAPGSYVNLGIGLPTLVSDHIPAEREVVFHSENGILGMGPAPAPGKEDPELINAGKQCVTAVTGACYFSASVSFGIMRGGHLDYTVLGAYQVSQQGDIANWHTGDPHAVPAVGGAMDLVSGARHVFVFMELFTRNGICKMVPECTYPYTGFHCIEKVYTDYAVFHIHGDHVEVSNLAGISFKDLQKKCAVENLVFRNI